MAVTDREQELIRDRLWTADVRPENYEGASEKYQAAILEQYKIYVEMADRIRAVPDQVDALRKGFSGFCRGWREWD